MDSRATLRVDTRGTISWAALESYMGSVSSLGLPELYSIVTQLMLRASLPTSAISPVVVWHRFFGVLLAEGHGGCRRKHELWPWALGEQFVGRFFPSVGSTASRKGMPRQKQAMESLMFPSFR